MKKIYLLSFLITGFCLTTSKAQTLTATGCNPTIGEIYNRVLTNSFSQGSSGTGQTWNISTLTGTSSSATVVSVGSTPNGTNHPLSNIAFVDGTNYLYYKTSSTAYQLYGVEVSVSIVYSNPEDFMRYPFSYTNTYTDTWAATFTSGVFFNRKGSTTVTADGTGTLITPNGTISNVIRVHSVQIYSDSADLGGTPYVITYNNDQYFWYKDGIHFPLASTYNLTSSASAPTTGGFYTDLPIGIKENSLLSNDVILTPNPANEQVLVSYLLEKNSTIKLSVFNVIGEEVFVNQSSQNLIGKQSLNIDLKNLEKGVYFVRIQAEGESVTKKLIVQ